MSLRLTYNHCRLFLFPPGKGPKQDPTNQAWACQWCPKEYIASWGSYYNLKAHRDGAMIKGCLRGACTGRQKAIQAGSHIPLSVSERNLAKAQGRPTGQGTLIGYTTRGRFDNQTLNKLIVVWIIRQSLPWLQIEDFLLRVAFNYTTNTAQLHSRVWAAAKAHQLYLEQQAQVIKEIKDSKSKLSLVSDVWTKKGSHKAFIGMTACYITPDWTYKCHHLAIKYVSWHHNGKYLATPFANVLTDSGSNNFTMAKGVAAIFRRVDSTYWDVEKNHHQCICHLIALILRAGLKALKLLTGMVIKRLLENEDGRLAGKSAKDHYFKSYELTSKEWEEINNLNDLEGQSLSFPLYFLELTKQMEGDGPKLAMVLYEYSRVLNFLKKKNVAAILTALELMFYPMIVVTNKYIELAINWDTVVLATFLHPTWRMKLIHKQFESHVPRITDMILEIFQARDMYLKSLQPETPPVDPQSDANGEAADLPSDSDGDEFNFYPQDSQAIEVNTELERYNNGNFPLDKKGCFLVCCIYS
ncbi:hypothetical protein PSTG_14255 [Puccinia striiformis f. sp. tritici PST-78]|uniref:DUF659 domain-containing protein n=1 Tax=Puccinia striiformis f. sp. tritici PST-78 TaxID=1165861 RepID=A0A0L0UZJ6_9BASI|nr:hypothetical protein PSTG_14255 [Puccinia striiformis f. sp. tritici PST-78]